MLIKNNIKNNTQNKFFIKNNIRHRCLLSIMGKN